MGLLKFEANKHCVLRFELDFVSSTGAVAFMHRTCPLLPSVSLCFIYSRRQSRAIHHPSLIPFYFSLWSNNNNNSYPFLTYISLIQ